MNKTKTHSVKSISSGIVAISMLGSNLAMAYDTQRFQELSPEHQAMKAKIEEKIDSLSEKQKISVSYKLYKIAFKGFKNLSELTDEAFTAGIKKNLLNKTLAADETLDDKEMSLLSPSNEMISTPIASNAQIAASLSLKIFSAQVRTLVESVGYNSNSSGKTSPLSREAFTEQLLSMSSHQGKNQVRSIASISLRSFLMAALCVVSVLAAVGLIVMFPLIFMWIGIGIIGFALVALAVLGVSLIIGLGNAYSRS